MMEYNTQNHWDFGLCPSSGILKHRKYYVTKTWSLSVFRWGEGVHLLTLLGFLERTIEVSLCKGSSKEYDSFPSSERKKQVQCPNEHWTKSKNLVILSGIFSISNSTCKPYRIWFSCYSTLKIPPACLNLNERKLHKYTVITQFTKQIIVNIRDFSKWNVQLFSFMWKQ
jgi:hypothetical protein